MWSWIARLWLGEWSKEEQARFLEAIKLYHKDWNLVTQHVIFHLRGFIRQIGTRSKQQVQSHAQKYQKHLDDIVFDGRCISPSRSAEMNL